MKFSATENIKTTRAEADVLQLLQEQFQRVSSSVDVNGSKVRAKMIAASFGSANRSDTTTISVKQKEGGFIITADTDYQPSGFMWFLLLVLMFSTGIGFFVPIFFYYQNKQSVVDAIATILRNVKNELE